MHIQAGHTVLDVGCGPGTDTIPLADLVGPTGYVLGIDYDAAMIAEANQRAEQAGVSPWVEHQQANATLLPLESEGFDSCRSERLLQHLLNPEQALSEMIRITKAGGWIVVLDTDYGTMSVDISEVEIERRIARVVAERCVHNGYSGRQLYRMFKRHNLLDLSVEIYPTYLTNYAFARQALILDKAEQEALAAGLITIDELHRWRVSLEEADKEGVFFCSGSMVMLAGRKP